MATFEYIVRPAVFPDIRPRPSSTVTVPNDPKQGRAVITGSSAKIVSLPYSYSMSFSETRRVETQRRVDRVRVYQQLDDGTVNEENFVDVDVASKVWMRQAEYESRDWYKKPTPKKNVKILQENIVLKTVSPYSNELFGFLK